MHIHSCTQSESLPPCSCNSTQRGCVSPAGSSGHGGKRRRANMHWQVLAFSDPPMPAHRLRCGLHVRLHRLERRGRRMEAGREGKDNKPGIKRLVSVRRICVTGFFGGGGDGDDALHCIASFSRRSLTHSYISIIQQWLVFPSITAHSSLPLPHQDSCLLRPRLQDRVLHCHHLNLAYNKPLAFFFSVQFPLPPRLPHWGRYAPLLSCIDWPRDGGGWATFGAGTTMAGGFTSGKSWWGYWLVD